MVILLGEYWKEFNNLANRVVPNFPSLAKLALIPPLIFVVILLYGLTLGGALATLSAVFLAFFIVPGVVIFRHLDTRAWVEIEEIIIDENTNTHRQYSLQIKTDRVYQVPGFSGRTFKPGDLYRDALKRRKWLYYFLMGYRARCVLVYVGEEKTPRAYTPPAVPGEILYTAYTTKLLQRGLDKVWKGSNTFTTLILIALLVIVVVLGASWLQASGIIKGV
jgi:hypothetical protein